MYCLRKDTVVLALVLLLPAGCGGRSTRPVDVILITIDTTRADHLGAYGYHRDTSPVIDAFAKEAVLYRRAWSTASWTLPAHASMFTGKYPKSHGAHFNAAAGDASLGDAVGGAQFQDMKVSRLGDQETTLAELLGEAGYETGAFVGGPFLEPVFGILQGYKVQDAEIGEIGGRRADDLTRRVIAWLKSVPPERPVHLFVNYFDPHGPYDPPPEYKGMPMGGPVRLPASAGQALAMASGEEIAGFVDLYDREIRFMDAELGKLLDALRKEERYEEALIVIVADHGESFGEHGHLTHGRWLYEEVLRVPLLIRFPEGRGGGREVSAPVSVVDLLPLISRETGVRLPPGVEGVPMGRRKMVLAESYRDKYFVKHIGRRYDRDLVTGVRWPWKVIWSSNGPPELYRLDADPLELNNLADGRRESNLLAATLKAHAELAAPERLIPPKRVRPETEEQLRSLGYIE